MFIKPFFILLILIALFFLHGPETFLMVQGAEKTKPHMRQPTTYDRISRATDFGEISLKEAVLLKAKLLFAPGLIPEESKFTPGPGEARVDQPCLTGFFTDVHRVFHELSTKERTFLRSLSPDLEVIIRTREQGR